MATDESGARLPLSRTNGPFLPITVPRGSHRVVLRYTPPGLRPGVTFSAAGVVFAALGALLGRRARTRPSRL